MTLKTEVPPGLPELFVDPDRIQLVFSNLLGNAIRYSPPDGTIVLRARLEVAVRQPSAHKTARAERLHFEITDGGPGVPAAHQAALFEKFFRVPGSQGGGSGLGLFITKGLVNAHGGQVGVVSQEGRGATCWFTLPLSEAAGPPA